MKINAEDTFEYCGKKYIVHEVEFDSIGHIKLSASEACTVTGYTGSCTCFQNGHKYDFGKVGLTPEYITFDWAYAKQNSKYRIKKIQRNPKKKATTVIFENGHVEVVKRNELDPEADLYSVVAYAVAKYVYGSNSAFKRQIRDCIFESLEVKNESISSAK